MLEEVDRVTTLVDSLLRLSHADAGTVRLARTALDLRQLTHDVVTSLTILPDEKAQHLVEDAGPPVTVFADGLVLREALTNVIDNASNTVRQGRRFKSASELLVTKLC